MALKNTLHLPLIAIHSNVIIALTLSFVNIHIFYILLVVLFLKYHFGMEITPGL